MKRHLQRHACVIPDQSLNRVLLVATEGCWDVPEARIQPSGLRNPTPDLLQVLAACGLETLHVSLVRFLRLSKERIIWECQSDVFEQPLPQHARWAAESELPGLGVTDETRQVIAEWFREVAHPPAGRAPWECQGWWQHAWAWIVEQLPSGTWAEVDRSSSGKLCSPWGYAVRVRTDRANLFFKAVPTWSRHEPRLTATLSRLFPEHLPRVVAVEENRGWLLMEDFGPHLCKEGEGIGRLGKAIGQVGQLQIRSIEHLDELAAAGCPDLRGDELAELEALFESIACLLTGATDPVVAGVAERTMRALEAARSIVCQAIECNVPHALVHGDATWINMAVPAESASCIFFDWGDSCISHPLMDAAKFARFHPAEWEQIQEAYFDPWRPLCSASQLRASLVAAQHLERIHELRRYVQVYPRVEPWLSNGVLKWIVDLVDQLAAIYG